ncbi:IS1096 element passenger TnpR family protein [Fervidobacterium sp.]
MAVLGRTTLYRLARAIIDAFGFRLDHLFGFYDNTKSWAGSKIRYELNVDLEGKENIIEPEEIFKGLPPEKLKHLFKNRPIRKGVKNTKVSQVFEKPRQRMLFLFDYGDEWHFIVELKKIVEPEQNIKYPTILETFGEAPEQYPEYEF